MMSIRLIEQRISDRRSFSVPFQRLTWELVKKIGPDMQRHHWLYLSILLGLMGASAIILICCTFHDPEEHRVTPSTNKGKKWRIGYYEGGPYINYPANLKAIAEGLAKLGWIEDFSFPETGATTDSRAVWEVLSRIDSRYIHFVPDAYWSAGWDDLLRIEKRSAALFKLQIKSVDFIIAMGTWAGQDLANDLHGLPTMVVSTSDPIQSGIIKSATDSGFSHVHAKCDPNRYIRQLRLFHEIFGFKRLGLVYENSVEGRSYAAIADAEKVAEEKKFELIKCEAPFSGIGARESSAYLIQCHHKLASQIDALFLTVHRGVDLARMDEILAPLLVYKIPTWSQRGPVEVRHGVLLSIARSGFKAVGEYQAGIMAKILNGARPGELNQIFEDPKRIAINMNTASMIGFNPPAGLMKVADERY